MADSTQPKQSSTNNGPRPLLRRLDQAVIATLVSFALVGMTIYWVIQGGPRGELIEIDRAKPLAARYLVDLNKAAWPEFAELPDVGETLARRIVESRETAGAFRDHGDLRRVRGIGPRMLEKLKPYLLPMPGQQEVAGDTKPQAEL